MKISAEMAREFLHYEPETGIFTWRARERRWFGSERACRRWNTMYSGKRAGSVSVRETGYQLREIRLLSRHCYEHRLAWMWMSDDPLPPQIDHKNRDGTDNRWSNLRASSCAENARNHSMQRNNSSGVTGVGWHKQSAKWRARCWVGGKDHFLGLFDELDKAAMEVMEFRAAHGFTPSHGLSLASYREEKAS